MSANPRCIYCKQPNKASGHAHVIPEAIFGNPLVLPKGTVCDKCNAYCGNHLDGSLSGWPSVAVHVQFLQLPGKRGRIRSKIGPYELREHVEHSYSFQFQSRDVEVEILPSGKHQVTLDAPEDPHFEMRPFRRALHYVALNGLAAARGGLYALRDDYDPVRRYVRHPKPKEEWPFAVAQIGNDKLRSLAEIHPFQALGARVMAVQLFRDLFAVSLIPDPAFEEVATSHGFEVYKKGQQAAPGARLRYIET